jgi:hypothetical protein
VVEQNTEDFIKNPGKDFNKNPVKDFCSGDLDGVCRCRLSVCAVVKWLVKPCRTSQADGHESWMVGGVGQKVSVDKSAIVRWRDKLKQKTHRAA